MPSMEHGEEDNSDLTELDVQPSDGCCYKVPWTVYTALALPSVEDPPVNEIPENIDKLKRRSFKAMRAQSSYHIEYQLPGDENTVNLDLIVYGPLAKLYRGDDFKILRTLQEGDRVWVGWALDFDITINRDILISLLKFKMKVHIWNCKEKLSNFARHERIKAFRLPKDHSGEVTDGNVKVMLNKLRSSGGRRSNKCKGQQNGLQLHLTPVVNGTEVKKSTCDALNREEINKIGTAAAELSLSSFLAGVTSVTEPFTVCSAGVIEIICDVTVNSTLISERLKADLNPLVITVLSATSLPSSPIPFHSLQEKCVPVYCQYKFHNLNMHRTKHHQHGANVYFRDINVILTGLINPEELRQFLSGPPLEIEVHDRDRKLKSLRETAFNYHGVASLNLSELLLGQQSMRVLLPIKNCPPPLLLGHEFCPPSSDTSDKAIWKEPIQQGHYYNANSQLKIKVELACPLNTKNSCYDLMSCKGLLGHIVYLFHHDNLSVLTKLRAEIFTINALAFHLGSCSLQNIKNAMSNYILNFKYDKSKDLDFVTGFHVLDTQTHIFVLEGLKDKAVRRLWEAVPMKLSEREEEQVIVLYNSDLIFFRRIYDSLDLGLGPIRLSKSFEAIMRQPSIYTRGMIPQACFQALSRLKQLSQVRKLRDVVQYNLFPSADMILSLSRECGTEKWEPSVRVDIKVDTPCHPVRIKRHAPLDTHHETYKKQLKPKPCKDFIQDNIRTVKEESERLQKPKAAMFSLSLSGPEPQLMYSTHTFKSREQVKEILRHHLAQMPGRRFTYCQEYHSATVELGGQACQRPLVSTSGPPAWSISRSSSSPFTHPKKPDEARVEELRKPWRENILHGNILKPTLQRDVFVWSQRHRDFELYSKPPLLFSSLPNTIHLAGRHLQLEQLETARAQYSRWLEKLLPPSSPKPPGGRWYPEFKCHVVRDSGRRQDILKDEPRKFSLRKPGMLLKPIPQLSVMNLSDDAKETSSAALLPGPCTICGLASNNNHIPSVDSQYSKYHYFTYSKQHCFLYKRAALPLTEDETRIFTFHKQDQRA